MPAPINRPSIAGLALLLALLPAACAAPPRSNEDIDTGRFDVSLAFMYLDGNGVPRDDTKAAYLLSTASAVGNSQAKEMLGRLYADGRGVARDDELATNLFRYAIDAGNVPALTDLGQMLETGRAGTPPNADAALKFYERGMDAGDERARDNYQRLKNSQIAAVAQAAPPPAKPQIISTELPPTQ